MSTGPIPSGRPPSDELIDAYLDGLLSPAEADVIERAIAADPRLSAEMKIHRLIEGSLRSRYEPPRVIELNLPEADGGVTERTGHDPFPMPIQHAQVGGGVVDQRPARWKISRGFLAAAAVLVLTGATLWMSGVLRMTPEGLISAEAVYVRKVSTGFNPDWVCTNDLEFEEVGRKAFGQALQIPKESGVEVVGWAYYEPVLSTDTFLLLVKVDGVEAIVVIDCRAQARSLSASRSSGLEVHSRKFDNVVMYQTSKKGTRNILPAIYNPDGKPVGRSCGGGVPANPGGV